MAENIRLTFKFGYFIYFFLVAGFLNAILRPEIDSSITLFRILLPFAMIYLAIKNPRDLLNYLIIAIAFIFYSVTITYTISKYQTLNIVFVLHYLALIFLFFFIKESTFRIGYDNFYVFLKRFYILMIILCAIQFFFGGVYPNTMDRTGQALNIFFYNEGDLTACIAFFMMFIFLEKKSSLNYLLLISGFLILIYCEARLALISLTIFIVFILFKRFAFLGLLIAGAVLLFVFIFYGDKIVLGGNNLSELLVEPFQRMFNLDPYPTIYGSIYTRTNAVIFGTKELINSYGFGIGPGGSYYMLESAEYHMADASSMHNFIFQVLTELGYFGLLLLIAVTIIIGRFIVRAKSSDRLKYVVFYFCSALIITSLSSSAYSNYLLFTYFYFSIFYFKHLEAMKKNPVDSTDQQDQP